MICKIHISQKLKRVKIIHNVSIWLGLKCRNFIIWCIFVVDKWLLLTTPIWLSPVDGNKNWEPTVVWILWVSHHCEWEQDELLSITWQERGMDRTGQWGLCQESQKRRHTPESSYPHPSGVEWVTYQLRYRYQKSF